MQLKVLSLAALAICPALMLHAQVDTVPAGTGIVVRTNEAIDARSPSDSRIYQGSVDRDVRDHDGRVQIPRGSNAELILRDAGKNLITVDLESIEVNGRRYSVDSATESVNGGKEGVGANKRTGKYVGGGALLGTIIGAIAGGGKGAAIGAATGAGAGAVGQTVTRGGKVRLPAESVLTFRLQRELTVSGPDKGLDRDDLDRDQNRR
jgi:hypothetical protein